MAAMSNVAARARRLTENKRCGIGQFGASLTEEEREEFERLLEDFEVTAPSIRVGVLEEYGHDLSVSSLNRHRRKVCSCH